MVTDEILLERGYKQYNLIQLFDSDSAVARFQKRFDDKNGKKYFIDAVKYSHYYIPQDRRGDWWKPFDYEFKVQLTINEKAINFEFFSDWEIDEVEEYVEKIWQQMGHNYYERWDEY